MTSNAIQLNNRQCSAGWRIAAALATLCVLGAATPRAGMAASVVAAVPSCQTDQLSISVEFSDHATGHVADQFRIHNRSYAACTLFGFPGAQLLDAAYHAVPTHLTWGPGYGARPPRLVTLAPRGNAYFVLDWVHFSSTGGECPTMPYLRITPPNTFKSLTVTDAIDTCGGRLTASPVEPTLFF